MSTNELPSVQNPEDIAITQIALPGNLARDLEYVSSTGMALLISVGKIVETDEAVLAAFVDLDIELGSEADVPHENPLSTTISFDNAAFTVNSLAENLSSLSLQLCQLSSGDIRPEPGRVALARYFVSQARDHLVECLDNLSRLEGLVSSRS
jgi:hypothetical protein